MAKLDRKPISKTEAKYIKRRLGWIQANFNELSRHQLRHKLEILAKSCDPRPIENGK